MTGRAVVAYLEGMQRLEDTLAPVGLDLESGFRLVIFANIIAAGLPA